MMADLAYGGILFSAKRVRDANVWLSENTADTYRVIERDDQPGIFVAEERLMGTWDFVQFMTANTLAAAIRACDAMMKNPDPQAALRKARGED